MRNFKYVKTIKDALEKECPNTVSCADIVALSARDGAVMVFLFIHKLINVFFHIIYFSKIASSYHLLQFYIKNQKLIKITHNESGLFWIYYASWQSRHIKLQ